MEISGSILKPVEADGADMVATNTLNGFTARYK